MRNYESIGPWTQLALDTAINIEGKLRYGNRMLVGEDGTSLEEVTIYPNTPTVIEGEGMYYKDPQGHLEFSDPSTQVLVRLKPASIPKLLSFRFLPNGVHLPTEAHMLGYLHREGITPPLLTSTKSRLAMVGVEASDQQEIRTGTWRRLASGHDVVIPITFNNYLSRPVQIPEGMPLFRFFSPMFANNLEGDDLVRAHQQGLIQVDGEQGNSWEWTSRDPNDPTGLSNHKDIFGMRIKLKPQTWWIPPSDEPIRMEDLQGPDYRNKIDAMLQPVPLDLEEPVLCIAESHPLRLAKPISGYLSLWAGSAWGRQINSRFLDPVKTNWGIRVEQVLAPASINPEDQYMEVYFSQDEPSEK